MCVCIYIYIYIYKITEVHSGRRTSALFCTRQTVHDVVPLVQSRCTFPKQHFSLSLSIYIHIYACVYIYIYIYTYSYKTYALVSDWKHTA